MWHNRTAWSSSRSALQSLAKALMSCYSIFLQWLTKLHCVGNIDKSSQQIFHTVLCEAPICCAKLCFWILDVASCATPTHSSVRTDALRLLLFAHLSHTLPVSSNCSTVWQMVSLDCATWAILSLHSSTRTTRKLKGFVNDDLWSIVYDDTFLLSSAFPTVANNFLECVEWSLKVSCNRVP